MINATLRMLPLMALLLLLAGCQTEVIPIQGTAQPRTLVMDMPEIVVPPPSAEAAWVPEGYRAEIVVHGLIYPTSVDGDPDGNLYIAEAGWIYGDPMAQPRLLRISPDGQLTVLSEELVGPVNDILWHQDRLLISHRGKISQWRDGVITHLVTGLPSLGDHQNNQLAIGPEGMVYFGQGTVTNSGVPGMDSFVMGWLKKYPKLHDIPARDIALRGVEYLSPNPFVATIKGEPIMAVTQPFSPFGTNEGARTIPGEVKANGTILRFPLENPDALDVYAWGLRNPFGIAWTPRGLLVAENGFDDRGTRPVANAPDTLWLIRQGAWYGWPDYASGIPVTDQRFVPYGKEGPEFLMANHPPVESPFLTRPEHVSVAKLALSPGGSFGYDGHIFMAEFGDMAPLSGILDEQRGRDVVRIDPMTKKVEPFFHVRKGSLGPDPATQDLETPGPRRPLDVYFDPQGRALYIVDLGAFGMMHTSAPTVHAVPGTGILWRVIPDGIDDLLPAGNLQITPVLTRNLPQPSR